MVEAISTFEGAAGVEGAKENGEAAGEDGLPRPSFIEPALGALPLIAPNENGEEAACVSVLFSGAGAKANGDAGFSADSSAGLSKEKEEAGVTSEPGSVDPFGAPKENVD